MLIESAVSSRHYVIEKCSLKHCHHKHCDEQSFASWPTVQVELAAKPHKGGKHLNSKEDNNNCFIKCTRKNQ